MTSVRFRVRFSERQFSDDLENAGASGRPVLTAARETLEREGIDAKLLMPCSGEHRDGTDLGGLVKLYLPVPYGPWGLVLAPARDQHGLFLRPVAFGQRHPTRRPTVYDVAHYRRHGSWPPGSHGPGR